MKITSLLSKQKTLFLIGLLTLSTLFLPLTTLRAATLANGMDAAYVLGEPDFVSTNYSFTQSGIIIPVAMSFDEVNNRLFVLDGPGDPGPTRVLVFDLSSGITNGMNASYVIGQENFTDTATGTDADSFNVLAYDIEYESSNQQLFVADYNNHRVLVFDLSGGITNGMNATYALGQPDLVTGTLPGSVSSSSTPYPTGLAYDSDNDYLFVGNAGQARVMVFDLSGGITNGMPASWILGQENATSSGGNLDQDGMLSPQYLDYDEVTDRLFVALDVQRRVLVYDLSGPISTGMDAAYVIGQENFTSNVSALDRDGLNSPQGVTVDSTTNRLFVADGGNNRVISYDLDSIANGMDASYVLGQVDFISNSTGTTQSTFWEPRDIDYDTTNKRLFVADGVNSRVLIFNLTPTPSSSGGSLKYIHPPTCTATFSPSTITKGQSTTLSWNTQWPSEKTSTYYTKVPTQGLYSSKVQSLTLEPQHTTEYTLAIFNLWGANFCTTTITVLDEEGQEITTNPNNSQLTAGVSNSPIVRAITTFFSRLFVR